MNNQTLQSMKEAIRQKYAWPGGYPLVLIMDDGECLCMGCAQKEWKNIYQSTKNHERDGWQAAGVEINWENPDGSLCAHCNNVLESAYTETEETGDERDS